MNPFSQLRPVIESALLQTQPHCGRGVGSGLIFTGNYDWHSSVHAHWALLSMARVSGDDDLRARMLKRLSPDNLAAEHRFLADDVEFELPYGRAWLALLLGELERHPHGYDALPQLRELIESQVIGWLERTRFDDEATVTEGENVACGSHQSWLFAFLLLQLSAPSPPIRARLDALFPRIDAARPGIARARHTDYDFLFLPAVLRVIDKTHRLPASDRYRHSTRPKWQSLEAHNCHTAGAGIVRLWPLAFDGKYSRALERVWPKREQWQGDFHLVSHWVPQFIWLGLMLERGEFTLPAPEHNQMPQTLKT